MCQHFLLLDFLFVINFIINVELCINLNQHILVIKYLYLYLNQFLIYLSLFFNLFKIFKVFFHE
jgi:hypothetical protein